MSSGLFGGIPKVISLSKAKSPPTTDEGGVKMSRTALRKVMEEETTRNHFAREQAKASKIFGVEYVEEFGEPLMIVDPVEEGGIVLERQEKNEGGEAKA